MNFGMVNMLPRHFCFERLILQLVWFEYNTVKKNIKQDITQETQY